MQRKRLKGPIQTEIYSLSATSLAISSQTALMRIHRVPNVSVGAIRIQNLMIP